MMLTKSPRQMIVGGANKGVSTLSTHAVSRQGRSRQPRTVVVAALERPAKEAVASGVAFDQVQAELVAVDKTNPATQSFARVNFTNECESAINQQINIEYNISYVYHSLYQYFDRDNVGLPGIAKYFKEASDEEREHAELLMKYQNKRGGRVKLQTIVTPESEFNHDEKGDALFAFELALSLEKLNFTKLRDLHAVACVANDAAMTSFIEEELLVEQVEAVKTVSEYVSQLRRIGKGLGVYLWSRQFLEEGVVA